LLLAQNLSSTWNHSINHSAGCVAAFAVETHPAAVITKAGSMNCILIWTTRFGLK
jgi:hypothetical protein